MPSAKYFKLKAPVPLEADECSSLMLWASTRQHFNCRLSEFLIMIPNGAALAGDIRQRAIAMSRMKRHGFRPGVSDYFLAIPVGSYGGLWLEIKRIKSGVISPEQQRFGAQMVMVGYQSAVAAGWQSAVSIINLYLQGKHATEVENV